MDSKTIQQKLDTTAEDYGCTLEELLDIYGLDSVVPGVCMNANCDYVEPCCEPDARENWCELCETNTVCSVVALALFGN